MVGSWCPSGDGLRFLVCARGLDVDEVGLVFHAEC